MNEFSIWVVKTLHDTSLFVGWKPKQDENEDWWNGNEKYPDFGLSLDNVLLPKHIKDFLLQIPLNEPIEVSLHEIT